jgi:uncharacterized protein YcfJ
MRKPGVAVAVLVAAVGISGASRANDQGAVAGAASGAVLGAVVGGPIGAVIGAAVGGVVVGSATGPNTYSNLQHEQVPSAVQQRRLVQPQVPRDFREPITTGSVIDTTCIRDRRGNTRCRNEVVR